MKTKCCNTHEFLPFGNKVICINSDCKNYLEESILSSSHKWKAPIVVSIFIFGLLLSFNDFSMENNEQHANVFNLPWMHSELTMDILHQELVKHDILCPDIVYGQIKIESGNLTSSLFHRTNNMLGMRYPFKRNTTASGIYIPAQDTVIYGSRELLKKYRNTKNYAVYNSWSDAIKDYKLWQQNCFVSTERYLGFLGNVYAEDSAYINKIKIASRNAGQ
jgi:hypothetical protein